MAAGSSETGIRRVPMTPGRLKRCPAGERDSFESHRVTNRYSERIRAAGEEARPPAAVMYLNGLCLSAFARRHYDACAMDTVQTDTLTERWTDLPTIRPFGYEQCCSRVR